MPPSQDQGSPSRPSWIDRTSQIATAVAAGTFVNVFSDRTALKRLAVAAVTALSLVTVKRLRKRPGAAMSRYATRIAACGALAGSAWAATASTTLAVTIAIISAVIGGAAVIMQSDPTRAIKLLMRMIAAGTTVTMVGSGAQALLSADDRTAFVYVILGCALLGVTVWADDMLEHATGAFEWDEPLIGHLTKRHALTMTAVAPVGLLMSLQTFLIGFPFRAVTLAAAAVSLLMAGIAIHAGSESLLTSSTILFGLSLAGNGIGFLSEATMFGTMGLIIGSAVIALGLGRMRPTLVMLRRKLIEMSEEPGQGHGPSSDPMQTRVIPSRNIRIRPARSAPQVQ